MIKSKSPGNPLKKAHTESAATLKQAKRLQYLLPAIVLLALLLIWYFVTYINLFPAYALPSPHAVWKSFLEEIRAGRLVNDIIASLWRVAVGFVLSATLGIPTGLWLGQNLYSRKAFTPMLN